MPVTVRIGLQGEKLSCCDRFRGSMLAEGTHQTSVFSMKFMRYSTTPLVCTAKQG